MSAYLERLFALDGRIAVVTGGSSGIGQAIAGGLAGAGASVVLIARRRDALAAAAARLRDAGGAVSYVGADLADREAVLAAARQAATGGNPDILVNCAAVSIRPPLPDLTAAPGDPPLPVNPT